MSTKRALHYVFKVADRKKTVQFYTEVLGMKILRHEEFEEGCKATCNGPYDGKWSKTMVGYGPEEEHFVAELTYNYGVKSYKLGNVFLGIAVSSQAVVENAKKLNWPVLEENNSQYVEAPGGYRYFLVTQDQKHRKDPVERIVLASSNLQKSVEYWSNLIGMKIYEKQEKYAVLGFSEDQVKLELRDIGGPVSHEEAFGRIAFSCPTSELAGIQEEVKKAGHQILTPLVSLDTPGKATVHVVILADPDGHEICFVGDETFRELSEVDPNGEALLQEAIANDKSDEWMVLKKNKITK